MIEVSICRSTYSSLKPHADLACHSKIRHGELKHRPHLNLCRQRFSRTSYNEITCTSPPREESEPSSVRWEATDDRDRANERHGVIKCG